MFLVLTGAITRAVAAEAARGRPALPGDNRHGRPSFAALNCVLDPFMITRSPS
jgi:hypothetical protein